MAESKATSLTKFDSVQDLAEFFDTHDMGNYISQMPEAEFEVDIKKRSYLVAIDGEVMKQLVEIAKSEQVSAEMLINAWLREKALKAA